MDQPPATAHHPFNRNEPVARPASSHRDPTPQVSCAANARQGPQGGYAELFYKAAIVVAVALIPVLVWYLFNVVLVAFGAVIVAMLLWLGAEPFVRWLSVRQDVALAMSGLIILAVLAGAAYLFGSRVAIQLQDVSQLTASGASGIQHMLQGSEFGRLALDHITGSSISLAGLLEGVLQISSSVLEGVIVAVISGIYLAAQPRLYAEGLIALFPPEKHARVAERLDVIGSALRLWLIGQLVQMALIGSLAVIALEIIGIPASLALGLITALGEFVPYIGPILAAIPAILVAVTKSPEAALWTAAAYVAINQIEGNLVVPLIQRHLVFIPPAVILLGIIAITNLFGVASFVFAAPITVVIFVAVKVLYVRETLGEETKIPGETPD